MTNVEIKAAALPDNTSSTLFEVSGSVRLTGLTGLILVQADDPYTVAIRVGGVLVTSIPLGGQSAGVAVGGSGGAGPSLADMFAFGGAAITVESSGDPGAGEVEWFVTYEPLAPNATIVAA